MDYPLSVAYLAIETKMHKPLYHLNLLDIHGISVFQF